VTYRPNTRNSVGSDGKPLKSYVHDVVRERLLDGRWAAGEFIAVDALRFELGVSRQPVMDALHRLATDDLVEIIPQVGCRVPVYQRKDLADFFAIFAAAEGEATAISARRPNERDLNSLEMINERISRISPKASSDDRAHEYRLLNRDFHSVVLDMADSVFASRVSRRMWDVSDLLINTVGELHPLSSEISERHDDHLRIISALRDRDENAARDLMAAHILRNIPMLETAGP
jgi:DNA-binding GntR family transcriptional regulator